MMNLGRAQVYKLCCEDFGMKDHDGPERLNKLH